MMTPGELGAKISAAAAAPIKSLPHIKADYDSYCNLLNYINGRIMAYNNAVNSDNLQLAKNIADNNGSPLQDMIRQFTLHNDQNFCSICQNCGWPVPEAPKKMAGQNNSATPRLEKLMAQYRNAVHVGTITEKTLILREILAIKDDPELRNVLISHEKQWQNELASAAKNAIINEDYSTLQTLKEHLESPEWTVEVNNLVISKINAVLDKHHLEMVVQHAAELLENINDAYSSMDLYALQTAVQQWDDLIDAEPAFTPSANDESQVRDARKYLNDELRQQKEDQESQELIKKLRTGMANGESVIELEKYISGIRCLDRDVPDDVMQAFHIYRDDHELISRRRKLLKTILTIVITIAILGLASYLTFFLFMRHQEKVWTEKLRESMAKNPAEISLKMLDELAAEYSYIRHRPSIIEIEQEIKEQKKNQDIKRKKFSELSQTVLRNMENFEANYVTIEKDKAALHSLIVDDKERTIYNSIDEQFKVMKKELEEKYSRKFATLAAEMENTRILFAAALERLDVKKAEETLQRIHALAGELKKLILISKDQADKVALLVGDIGSLEEKLRNLKKNMSEIKTLLKAIRSSTSFDIFEANVEKLAQLEGSTKILPQIQTLKENTAACRKFISQGGNELTKQDADRYNKLISDRVAVFRKLCDEAAKSISTTSMKMLIAQNKSGDICTLLFRQSPKLSENGNNINGEVKYIYDYDEEFSEFGHFFYNAEEKMIIIESDDRFVGKLIYPTLFNESADSLIQKYWNDMKKLLADSDSKGKYENVIFDDILKISKDARLHPLLKYYMIDQRLKLLITSHGGNAREEYSEFQTRLLLLRKEVSKDARWEFIGTPFAEVEKFDKNLQLTVAEFIDKFNKSDKLVELEMLSVATTRDLFPAGILIRGQNGEVQFRRFADAPAKGEIWYCNGQDNKFIVCGTYDNDKSDIKLPSGDIPECIAVFTPSDGKNTRQLDKKFSEAGVKLSESWPIVL